MRLAGAAQLGAGTPSVLAPKRRNDVGNKPQRVVVRTEEARWPTVDGEGDYETRVATVVNASEEPAFDV